MISTHILDTSLGTAASGVTVKLLIKNGGQWTTLAAGTTNADGRFSFDIEKNVGIYQIIFEIENYFKNKSTECFFQDIPVIFKVENTQRKYHVPLLLNPFGYSTYRGT